MTARVIAITGPAGCGKTRRVLARYREALADRVPQSTLWLAPTWRAGAAIRDRLLDGRLDGPLDGCFSPAVMTFDQFAEAVLKVAPGPVRPLDRLMKRRLIRRLVDEQLDAGQIRHFLPIARTGGLVDQIGELISELKRSDIWPDQFRRACSARGMTPKDAELGAIYEAYQQVLNAHQLYDAEGRFWSARKLLGEGQRRPFAHLRLVVVDGFTDFTPPQHEILRILAGWVEELLITLPSEAGRRAELFSKSQKTLAELRGRHAGLVVHEMPRPPRPDWPAMAHLEANLFADPRQSRPASDTTGVEILAASRQLGEIELIGSRIKRLLTEGDRQPGARPVRPGDVAVVFRSLGDVDGLVREVFDKLGIPAALESGQTLDRSPALAALAALIRLDVDDWSFRTLLAVLGNNYFQPDWPQWQHGQAAIAAERAIRSLQIPGGRARLLEQLGRDAGASTAPTTSTAKGHSRRDSAEERARQSQSALALLARLAQLFDELPQQATLAQWAAAWLKLAEQTGLLRAMEPDESVDAAARAPHPKASPNSIPDRLAWDRLQEALLVDDKLARLLGRAPRRLNRQEALAALLDTAAGVTIRDGVDESGRVRVLSAASVRTLRIPYLFFAGLAERSFPPLERQDRLYGEAERGRLIDQGLALVARAERSREEMLLFYEVMTRASERLYFSYPALDEAAQPLSPSPYLEEVEQACGPGRIRRTEVPDLSPVPTHDEPLTAAEFRVKAVASALQGDVALLAGLVRREPEPGLAENLLAGLRMVEARGHPSQFGPTEGMLEGAAARKELAARFGPEKTFSATELEQYASCPYRFFAERVLRLETIEELDLTVDYLARGRLVHGALADLHRRINARSGGPASPAALDEEEYGRLLAETLQQLDAQAAAHPLAAALREVDHRLWARWAAGYRQQHQSYDHEWRDCQGPLLPTWFEVSFGQSRGPAPSTDRPLELSTRGQAVRIAGRIDRIDVGTVAGRTVFNVLDYKTGTGSRFRPEDVAQGTALQLPLYVMAAQELMLSDQDAVPWRAGYWYVKDQGFKPRQALKLSRREDDRLEPEPDWDEIRETVLRVVAALVESIRGAQFRVASADEQCTGRCPFRTVCRISQIRSLEKTWQPLTDER